MLVVPFSPSVVHLESHLFEVSSLQYRQSPLFCVMKGPSATVSVVSAPFCLIDQFFDVAAVEPFECDGTSAQACPRPPW